MSVQRISPVFLLIAVFAGTPWTHCAGQSGGAGLATAPPLESMPSSGSTLRLQPSSDPPSVPATTAPSSVPNNSPGISGGLSLPASPSPVPRGLTGSGSSTASGANISPNGLPSEAGQTLKTYDLRPYTGYLTKLDYPHQAIVDWVLRDTGTDMWFSEPFGFLNSNRDRLVVYHTPEIQAVVQNVVDKFVAGSKDPQAVGLRVVTIGSPNWRQRAIPLMEHVNVATPGVQAWLVTKENAALLLSQLRTRSDAKEVQALDIAMYNGQTESLVSTRRRNYVRNIRPAQTGWPPYHPEMGEVAEGYQLEISPLLNTDGQTLDCVIRADIDQVEKLVPVDLDLPLPNGQLHRARVEVPQVTSWRLHERFRWPIDRVLVLSCGVIASPDRPQAMVPILNLESLTGQTAGRADALLFVEFKGLAAENIPMGTRVVSPSTSFNRGRY